LLDAVGMSQRCQIQTSGSSRNRTVKARKVRFRRSYRKQLARLIDRLAKDDVLVVTRLDRLARST
jgi:DNA invertase Pin-like site-specific DNA recombinase